jgi:hypothetical protein
MQLMNIKKQVLLTENQTFQEKLEALDLKPIAYKLMHPDHGQGWTRQQVDRAIANYKKFLHLLYIYPNSTVVPTQEIDQVWHQHILDTRKYAQDCQWLFGYFIHHYPYFAMGSDTQQQALETAFSYTRTLFIEHFGIDVIQNTYNFQEACAILPKGQLNQSSACIVLKERSLSSPSAGIEGITPSSRGKKCPVEAQLNMTLMRVTGMFANSLVMQFTLGAYPESRYRELKQEMDTDVDAFLYLPQDIQMSRPDFKNLSDRLLWF